MKLLEISESFADKLDSFDLFGITVINIDGVLELLVRFALNLAITSTIIGCLYYRKSRRKDYVFTFILISTTVFLLIFLLGNEMLQTGLALGLFAIFGIIRYRTETVPIREMTYLFLIIGISVINGLAERVSLMELLMTNLIFFVVAWVMESSRFMKHVSYKMIVYEKIDLIKPEKEKEMVEDIKKRTGLNVTKVEVGQIDFLKDTAFLKVYYKSDTNEMNTIDNITKKSQFDDD